MQNPIAIASHCGAPSGGQCAGGARCPQRAGWAQRPDKRVEDPPSPGCGGLRNALHLRTCLTALLFGLLAVVAATSARADIPLIPTLLTERGRLLVSEDFDHPPAVFSRTGGLKEGSVGWKLTPGVWEFVDGALKGTQVPKKHPAVADYAMHFKDCILQVDLKYGTSRQVVIWFIDQAPGQEAHHVCRATIRKDGFSEQKDMHTHDPSDAPPVVFGHVAMPFGQEWKTVLIEIKGDEMVTTIDGKSIAGRHPFIATEKAYFGFSFGGDPSSIRNLRVWEALPNPNWAETKKKLNTTSSGS